MQSRVPTGNYCHALSTWAQIIEYSAFRGRKQCCFLQVEFTSIKDFFFFYPFISVKCCTFPSYIIWKHRFTSTMCCLHDSEQLLLSVPAKVKLPWEATAALAAPRKIISTGRESSCGPTKPNQLRESKNPKHQWK